MKHIPSSSTPPRVPIFNGRSAKTLRERLLAVFLASISSGAALQAATLSYDGGPSGTGTDWGDPVNWSGDVLPTSADTAVFATPNTTLTIELGSSRTVGSLLFNQASTAYTLGSAADVLNGYSITLRNVKRDSTAGSQQTIASGVSLATANSIWDINQGFNNNLQVTGVIEGVNRGLTKIGNGTLVLANANTYSGDTIISAGILNLNFNAATAPSVNIINNSSDLVLGNGNGSLSVTGKNGASVSQTFASTTLQTGNAALSIANGGTNNTKSLVNLGSISRGTGATINFAQPTGSGSGNSTVGVANGFVTSNSNDATGILGAYATFTGTNGVIDWAANNGINIVAYTGYTDLAGGSPTILDAPTSNIRITNGSTGDVGQGVGTTTVNTIRSTSDAARTLVVGSGNTLRLGATGGILATGTGGLVVGASGSAGFLTAGGADNAAGEIVLHNTTALTINSSVVDNGTGAVALTKVGTGTAVLANANSHTGGTTVNQGTLALSAGTNRLATSGDITVNGGVLDLGTSTQNISGAVLINGGAISNGTIVKSGADYLATSGSISAVLGGAGVGLTKTGGGTLILAGNNSYTGTTTILEGRLNATVAGAIDGNIVVGSLGGTYEAAFAGSAVDAVANSASATVYQNGSFSLGNGDNMSSVTLIGGVFSSNNGYVNGGITMTGGTIAAGGIFGNVANIATNASSGTAVISGSLLGGASTKTFTVADGDAAVDLLLSGNIASGNVTKAGAGLMQINGNKTYTGTTTISAGVLSVDSLANGGVVSSTGTSSSAAANLQLRDGSTFRYTGSATSTDRLFTVGQNGAGHSATLDASGSGAVSFTNTGALAWGTTNQTRTLTLGGSNTGDNSLAATIGNNGTGAVSLTKNGGGKWILAGANAYTGTTTVNAGTLLVNGSLGNSTVEINSGVFGGSGVVGGAVNVNAGGTLAPGSSIETLDTGSVSFASASTFALEINTDSASIDLLNVNGSLSIAGGALLTLTDLGSGAVLDTTLTIINYGFWNGGFFTYNGNELTNGETFSYGVNNYTINYDDGGAVTLAVSAVPEPTMAGVMGLALGYLALARRRRN